MVHLRKLPDEAQARCNPDNRRAKLPAISMVPIHKASNMVDGILWVDSSDDSVAEIEGIASKSPSVFAGTTHMMRKYTNMSGFAMATHARAESSSFLWGRTVVIIDYSNYKIQLIPAK